MQYQEIIRSERDPSSGPYSLPGVRFFCIVRVALNLSGQHTDFLGVPADARRHVNKMCMAADVPLVESGTAGYLGQVQPILKVCQRLWARRS